MNIRPVLAASAIAGALLVAGAAPAFAAGPHVPPGCTFDQATGVLTCTTTTTSTTTAGPFNCGPGEVCATTAFGGFTGAQICQFLGTPGNNAQFVGMTLTEAVTTTTTTERYGLHGKIFDTSTSTGPPSLASVQGQNSCEFDR